MNRKSELLEMATEMGIKIVNANGEYDTNMSCIHLLNPNFDVLEDAIIKADHRMLSAIVIHSKQTWPYKQSVESVEVEQKLLA